MQHSTLCSGFVDGEQVSEWIEETILLSPNRWCFSDQVKGPMVRSTEKHMEAHSCFSWGNIWDKCGLLKGAAAYKTPKFGLTELYNALAGSLNLSVPKALLTSGEAHGPFLRILFLKNKIKYLWLQRKVIIFKYHFQTMFKQFVKI